MKIRKNRVAAALAVLAGGILLINGFPMKLIYRKEYKKVENVKVKDISDKEFDIPEGWQDYETNSFSFRAPSGLVYDRSDKCYTDVLSTDEAYRNDPTVRKVYVFGGTFKELGFNPMNCIHFSLTELGVEEDKVNSLSKAIGRGNIVDGIDVCLVGADLGTSDFKFRTYHNAETFFKLGGELAGWGFSEHIRHYSIKNDNYKAFITQCLDNVPLSDESFKGMRFLTWDKTLHNTGYYERNEIAYNPNVDPKNFSSFAAMHLLTDNGTDAVINVSTNDPETDMAVLSTVNVK